MSLAFDTFRSSSHEEARSCEPLVLTATSSWRIGSEECRGRRMSGMKVSAIVDNDNAAQRQVFVFEDILTQCTRPESCRRRCKKSSISASRLMLNTTTSGQRLESMKVRQIVAKTRSRSAVACSRYRCFRLTQPSTPNEAFVRVAHDTRQDELFPYLSVSSDQAMPFSRSRARRRHQQCNRRFIFKSNDHSCI